MIKDDNETTSETDAFTRATSVESKIAIAHLSRPQSRKQPKMHAALDGEQWEIMKILGKRRTRSGYKYNVR